MTTDKTTKTTKTKKTASGKPDIVTAGLIIIGDEILSGRTQDTNLAYLATWLNELGVRLMEARVIADDQKAIVEAVNRCRTRFDYVFTTGGIGPTHDDITTDAIARTFGVAAPVHDEALRRLRQHYGQAGLNPARRRMARIPEGASLIDNPISRAPGYRIENVFVLAGIPAVMQAMLESLRHELVGGAPVHSHALAVHLLESVLAGGLADIQDRNPDVAIGSYPFFRDGRVGANLVLRSTDTARIDAVADEVRAMIRGLGAEPIETPPGLERLGGPRSPCP